MKQILSVNFDKLSHTVVVVICVTRMNHSQRFILPSFSLLAMCLSSNVSNFYFNQLDAN